MTICKPKAIRKPVKLKFLASDWGIKIRVKSPRSKPLSEKHTRCSPKVTELLGLLPHLSYIQGVKKVERGYQNSIPYHNDDKRRNEEKETAGQILPRDFKFTATPWEVEKGKQARQLVTHLSK